MPRAQASAQRGWSTAISHDTLWCERALFAWQRRSSLFTVKEIATLHDLEALEPQWRELWNRDPRATPFQSPDWLIPWTRRLWGGGKLRVLAFYRAECLAGLAPLFEWGIETSYLSFLGSGISDYLDLIVAPDCALQAAGALLATLAGGAGDSPARIDLQEIRPDSPLLQAVCEPWQVSDCSACPVLKLPALELDRKFRADLHRAENRLRRASIELVRADESNWKELLEALFRLHAARWQEREGPGMLSTEVLQCFHREVACRFLDAGMLRLYGMSAGGHWIAVQYNFAAKGREYAYLSGFDPEWAKLSPGAVLLKHAIEGATAEGMIEFDFLRKREAFKYGWGAQDRTNYALVWTRA